MNFIPQWPHWICSVNMLAFNLNEITDQEAKSAAQIAKDLPLTITASYVKTSIKREPERKTATLEGP